MTPARVLVVDPPWAFGDKLPGNGRGAAKHYKTLTTDEIKRFPLPPLEADAFLFLWRVAAMQGDALEVVEAWGFVQKSEIVWKKLTRHGKRWFGMGRIVRAEHETCLVCTHGRPKRAAANVRSVFEACVGRHSEKPEEFYRLVEHLCGHGPYVELFARRKRENWTCFGDEIDETRSELVRPAV